jgi:hypothetical protein
MVQHIAGVMIADEHARARFTGGGSDRRGRTMLIAVPPDLMPPVSLGSSLFQRLRVIVIDDADMGRLESSTVVGELPPLRAKAALAASSGNPPRHPRRLQGELLCDESGRLYEKIGSHVRPVHQLVAGPRGEVLDLAPPARGFRSQPPASEPDVIDAEINEKDEPDGASWRELAPPSARPRVVRLGEFKTMLAPQLAHPERLRDAHRLSCRVRIFESTRTQRLDTMATDVLGGASGQLLPLTSALAARLAIAELVAHRGPSPDREPGIIFSGERVARLEVLDDPTLAAAPVPDEPRPPVAEEKAAAAPDIRGPKKTIPDRYVAPWQFAMSRDEAVYDLKMEAARPRLRAFFDRLVGAARSRRDFHKWQVLLSGKSLDDQLWAVRPPLRGATSRWVREWASLTLEAAGYDPKGMASEWEIYWRRKGGSI